MPSWTPKERLRWAFETLRDRRLKSRDKVVAVFCEGYVNPDGQFWVRKRTISSQLHMSEKSVQRSLKNLASLGYMRIKPRIGTTPLYTIQFLQETEFDPGRGQIGFSSQDTVVPLTSYKPDLESTSFSARPVNHFPSPLLSNGLEEGRSPSRRTDFTTPKDLGKYELALADRLGPNGYDILTSLPWPKLMFMLRKAAKGAISEQDLAEMRSLWLKKMTGPRGT